MDLTWIKDGLDKPGKTQRGLAAELGVDPSIVSRIINGKRRLRADEIEVVQRYLGSSPPGPALARNPDSVVPVSGDFYEATQESGDLPVYASAQGGADGNFLLSYDPIEWRPTPEPLKGVRGGYGFYVIGDSMEPRFAQGELLLVHPTRPPGPGDYVVIVFEDGEHGEHKAIVKRLIKQTSKGVEVSQFNPPENLFLPAAEIRSVQLVVGLYSS